MGGETRTIMRMFLDTVKHRFLPLIGWLVCSVLFVVVGGIGGAGIGYLCLALGWVEYPSDVMFSGLAFLEFPFVGAIVGLIAMHVVRVLCWTKLHRKCMEEHVQWSWKHTMGVALFDEVMWLVIFAAICTILVTCM